MPLLERNIFHFRAVPENEKCPLILLETFGETRYKARLVVTFDDEGAMNDEHC